jgi:hypothetical protein
MSIQMVYGGRDRVPGISAAIETFENEFTWGRWENHEVAGMLVDGTTRDTGNTNYTHILRAGLLMGKVESTDKLKVWDPTATDGSEYIYGVLKESRSMLMNGTSTDRLTGAIIISGGVRANRLIVPGTTNIGLAESAANNHLARAFMRSRFMFDDDFDKGRPENNVVNVSAAQQSGGITLDYDDSHKFFFNTGGTVTIALGSLVAYKGIEFTFFSNTATSATITVTSGSSNIKAPNVSAANSLSVDGTCRKIRGNGSLWLVETL